MELSKRDTGSGGGGEIGLERAENPVIAAIGEESSDSELSVLCW